MGHLQKCLQISENQYFKKLRQVKCITKEMNNQGYIKDEKSAIDRYKKEYSEYWNKILGGEGNITFKDDIIPNVVSDDED